MSRKVIISYSALIILTLALGVVLAQIFNTPTTKALLETEQQVVKNVDSDESAEILVDKVPNFMESIIDVPVEDIANVDANDSSTWKPRGMIGRIKIPSVNISMPVYNGDDDATLLKGAGIMMDTDPLDGSGITGISGHNWPTFGRINDLESGDEVVVTTYGLERKYKVTGKEIANVNDINRFFLQPAPSGIGWVNISGINPKIVLVTCFPLTASETDERVFVTAEAE
jgi:sortase A